MGWRPRLALRLLKRQVGFVRSGGLANGGLVVRLLPAWMEVLS
jgi:hypothetical protein